MFIEKGSKLKRVSNRVYQELTPSDNLSRPLEWRRKFRAATFYLKALRLTATFSVNDLRPLRPEDEEYSGEYSVEYSRLKPPKTRRGHSIMATVDSEEQRDTLYCFAKTEEESIFSVERLPDAMKVIILGGAPVTGAKKIPDGVFWGNLHRDNYKSGRDRFVLEAEIPVDQMEELRTALRGNPNLELEVSACILSFGHEVEDALGGWDDPRELIVEDGAPAPVHEIVIPPLRDEP